MAEQAPPCPVVCSSVCMGSCPVSCCTKLPSVASPRIYITPTVQPYIQPALPVPPAPSYFQPQQQPWPTTCPSICSTKCENVCPIHCCPITVLENLRRLANAVGQRNSVVKSLTPISSDNRLHRQGARKEPSSVLQPPPVSLLPYLSTSATSSSCPSICSQHCTRACTPECCVVRADAVSSTHLGKRNHVQGTKAMGSGKHF